MPGKSKLRIVIDTNEVKSEINICRDSKDNFILALCKDANADYLLTGDKDLLELRELGTTQILTISAFLSEIK